MSSNKPIAEQLGWKILKVTHPFKTPWIQLREDTLQIPGKSKTSYTYHVNKGSSCVVPLTSDGKIVSIRQYRYPVDAWCREFPAGGSSDQAPDLSMEDLARKELAQEIGATCDRLEYIANFFPANSLSEEICFVYLALGTRIVQAQDLDDSEVIEVCPIEAHEMFRLARAGEIKDSYSALSLFLCESRIGQLGYLSR